MLKCGCAKQVHLQGDCFSDDGRYRYGLWRKWREDGPCITFIMLNPSLATAVHSDPTVTRCERFAISWGARGIYVCNLFGLVSPYPEDLLAVENPVDEGDGANDRHIRDAALRSDRVILAWGGNVDHPRLQSRITQVRELLRDMRVEALDTTKSGQPKHPLYLKASLIPQPYEWPNNKQASARELSER